MLKVLADRAADIARLCEEYEVEHLRLFGSALTAEFDPERSDVDLLVDFLPSHERMLRAFFALKQGLECIIGFPVDRVEARNLRNPYIARTGFSSAQLLYGVGRETASHEISPR